MMLGVPVAMSIARLVVGSAHGLILFIDDLRAIVRVGGHVILGLW